MKIFTYIKNDSKRIQKKNFQKIGGLPLWKHLMYELCKINTEVFIDTDSKQILTEAKLDKNFNNKIKCYFRDKKFIEMENDSANALSPALLMVQNFLDRYVVDDNETIILTHVTSPFLKKETLKKAVDIYESSNYEFLHSVNMQKDFAFKNSFNNPINFNPDVVQRTQDLEPIYFSNGAFFIFTKKVFMKYNNRWGKNIYFYTLNEIEGMEIDYPEDLQLARYIYYGIEKEKNEFS